MRPITDFLTEFPRTFLPVADFGPETSGFAPDAVVDGHAIDARATEQALAAARQAGIDVGREAAEAAMAEQFAGMQEAHDAALAAARAEWAAQEGETLAAALRSGLEEVERSIASGVAAVLMPVVETALRARVAAELGAAINQLLTGGQGAVIELTGPADLIAPVAAAFEGSDAVQVSEGAGSEVSLRAGDTRMASQLGAWSDRLNAVLEATP